MTKVYTPKLRYLSRERVDKIAKDILGQCTEDREMALEGYRFFKDRVDNPGDGQEVSNADKALMLECLKIAQAAKRDSVKIVEVFAKASEQVAPAGMDKGQNVSFNDLDELTADD